MKRIPRIAVVGMVALASMGASEQGLGQGAIPPEEQVESDWIDTRRNQMEAGRHHASVIDLPSGAVVKGLSLSLGPNGELTVCYDTETAVCRALWLDGFIQFNGRRYGTINGSAPAGDPIELLPPKARNAGESVRWESLRVNDDQVGLEYRLGNRTVFERPEYQKVEGKAVVVRAFRIEPGSHSVSVPLVASGIVRRPSGAESDQEPAWIQTRDPDMTCVLRASDRDRESIHWLGEGARLTIDPSPEPCEFQLLMIKGHLRPPAALVERFETSLVGVVDQPGGKRWRAIAVRGNVSKRTEAYTLDTLTVPYQNPWNALMFLTGVDFLSNGIAAVCTMYGDVWLVKGIDERLEALEWHRFATGLFQPLGLQVIDNVVHVLGRDQVTALDDLNGDGYADVYRNHSNLIQTRPGHRFVTSLQSDADGNLYYVDPEGLHRIAADGASLTTIATGWRNPNGMGRSPDGVLTVAPQQGGWTPSSQISEVKPGGFYGNRGPRISPSRPLGYDPPLCWIPHAIDNSGASQVWGQAEGWGPLSGRMIHLSYGRCSMMLGLREEVNGIMQGGVVPLKGRFLSGAMRGAVNPVDDQLYVVGSKGWQTSALRDGSFQRVRYTGHPLGAAVGLKAFRRGLRITFSEPLDPDWANDVESFGIEQWNYRYAKEYGSEDYSVAQPDQKGRDTVLIEGARLEADGRSVFLEIPTIQPVMQMEIRYHLRSQTGARVRGAIYNTIHALREGP